MRVLLAFSLVLFLLPRSLAGQRTEIYGLIRDQDSGEPVEFATVYVEGTTEAAESAEATYDVASGALVMSGSVLLTQGKATIAGERLVADLRSGTGQMEGRVKTVFQPGAQCRSLALVDFMGEDSDSRIGFGQLLHSIPGAVFRAVVHHDQFTDFGSCEHAFDDDVERRLFIVYGHHHAEAAGRDIDGLHGNAGIQFWFSELPFFRETRERKNLMAMLATTMRETPATAMPKCP